MKWITKLIVLATIALPIAPVVVAEGRNEVARWYVAAAVNALHLKQGDHDALMRKALQWSDDAELTDAWRYRFNIAIRSDPSRIPSLLAEAAENKPILLLDAQALAEQLADHEQFQLAYETQLLWPIKEDLFDEIYLSHLNQLAYYRSLGNFDLEAALVDIEKVLKAVPANKELSRAAFLDTRAWILFRLGRPGEALVDMEKCINLVGETFDEQLSAIQAKLEEAADIDVSAAADSKTTTDSDSKQAKSNKSDFDWTIYGTAEDKSLTEAGLPVEGLAKRQRIRARPAAIIGGALYYHRAMILLALERENDAEEDLQWLRDHNLPADGTLF